MTFLHRRRTRRRPGRAAPSSRRPRTAHAPHRARGRGAARRAAARLRGLVSYVRPPEHSRLVDLLNEPDAVLPRCIEGARSPYVNKRHVARVAPHRELTNGPPRPFIERLFSEPARELTLETGQGAAARVGARPPSRSSSSRSPPQQIVGALAEIVPDDLRAGFPQPGLTVFQRTSGAARRGRDPASSSRSGSARAGGASPGSTGLAPRGAPPSGPVAGRAPRRRPSAPPRAPAGRRPPAPGVAHPRPSRPTRRAGRAPRGDARPPRLRPPPVASDSPPELPHRRRHDAGGRATARSPRAAQGRCSGPSRPRRTARSGTPRRTPTSPTRPPQARFRVNVFADRKGIGAVLRQIPTEILTAEKMGLSQHVLDLCFLIEGAGAGDRARPAPASRPRWRPWSTSSTATATTTSSPSRTPSSSCTRTSAAW